MLVLERLGAPWPARRLRRTRAAAPGPAPAAVTLTRATVIDVGETLAPAAAAAWLRAASEEEVLDGLAVLNRALAAFRLASADPFLHPAGRAEVLVARLGFGVGEQVATGDWSQAREVNLPRERQRRARVLEPQARMAALLGGREEFLVGEELALRARLDMELGHTREAALQVLIALDAVLAELPADRSAPVLGDRLAALQGQQDAAAGLAQSALVGDLSEADREALGGLLGQIEAALRARAASTA